MASEGMYRVFGALGSPYSVKMRAVMRYRRLTHVWVDSGPDMDAARKAVRAPVIPVVQFPDGSHHNDSTPLIFELERRHPGRRSIIPERESDAFLAFLIEDFADEWLTKAMFFYRWFLPVDQEQMSRWLVFDAMPGAGRKAIEEFAAVFRDRQVGRMALVGSTAANAPLIETTTRTVLGALEDHTPDGYFLFGSRPSLAEFALYGQLQQLATDPTPQTMMRAEFPYAYRWLEHIADLSGVEGSWRGEGEALSPIVPALLGLAGAVYLPFLKANAAALDARAETVRIELMGHAYEQAPFKYQVKCWAALKEAYAGLSAPARAEADALLEPAGCLPFLRDV